jgi:hypothetical protein
MPRQVSNATAASPIVCWGISEPLCAQVRALGHAVSNPLTSHELQEELCANDRTLLMYALPRSEGAQSDLWRAVEEARVQGRVVVLLAVAISGYSSYASVLEGARAGIASVIVASPLFDRGELGRSIGEAERALTGVKILKVVSDTLAACVSDPAFVVLRRTIFLAHAPITLRTLADSCQLHERSLRKYCARHKLPEPSRLIAYCRLLRAAHGLDQGLGAEVVCTRLGFPSSDALRKLVSRTLKLPLSRLTGNGALNVVCEHLHREVCRGPLPQRLKLLR